MRKSRTLEGVHRVLGRADERLAVEVERGIEHGTDPRPALELTDDAIVGGVPHLVEDMSARGTVLRMEGRDQLVTPLRIRRERQHHVRRGEPLGIHEIVGLTLAKHRRGERHPEVPALDHPVDHADHAVVGGVREDRAVAERPRPELHAAGAARDDTVRHEQVGDLLLDRVVLAHAVTARQVAPFDHGLDLGFVDVRSEIGRSEGLGRRRHPRSGAEIKVAEVGGADRIRLVAAGWKDEEIAEPALLGDHHVRLHVHEDAAPERQPFAAVALAGEARPAHQRFLENVLGATGDAIEAEAERGFEHRAVEGPAAPPLEAARRPLRHGERRAERGDGPLGLPRWRVGRQAHHLVFVLAGLHAEQQGHEGVERAQRARAARRRFVPGQTNAARARHRAAEAVARIVVGEHERRSARER